MSKILFYGILSFLFPQLVVYSQGWVQTGGIPQGSGVTDMLVRQSNGWIYVTTGSYNWPSEPGGVRVSTDGGDTWQNQTNSYVARTIIEGTDGNLYASIWPDPGIFVADGLYRSTNNGAIWTPLGFVQAGDNIFSIATSSTTPVQTIFAGTRNGVIRSTDNGSTFQNTSGGIPPNSWVRDLAVDSSGIVAAATTNGLFISTDNGNQWQRATGIPASDTVVIVKFNYPNARDGGETELYSATNHGSLLKSFESADYTVCTLVYLFDNAEAAAAAFFALGGFDFYFFALFAQSALIQAGIFGSTNPSQGFTQQNEGLPQPPKTSALSVNIGSGGTATLFTGLFQNSSGGAKVYKRDVIVGVERTSSDIIDNYYLAQNYPNPFNPSTTIKFSIPEQTYVKLEIFNSLGEKLTTLVSEELNAGNYKYEWNAEKSSSGFYFYKLTAGNIVLQKKMILLK